MGIAYFEKGQEIKIDGENYEMLREINSGVWQLEATKTGLLRIENFDNLLLLYSSSKLKFISAEDLITNNSKKSNIRIKNNTLDLLSEDARNKAKVKYAYVSEIKISNLSNFTHASLSPIINSVWDRLGQPPKKPNWVTIYRWWRRFDRSGYDICSLVDQNSKKGNRNRRYCAELLEIINVAVKTIYLTRERNTVVDTLDHAISRVYRENQLRPGGFQLPLPTRSLVEHAIKSIPAYDKHVARYGKQAALRQYRSVMNNVATTRPLQRAEIDHTRMDLFVVDDDSMLPLGRPWLTLCIDDCTRCVLGVSVSFEPPSYLTVARCLKDAFLPKLYLKEGYPNLKNTWNCYGVMETLVVDNGMEFHSESLEALCYSCGVTILYNPRKTPWFKGKIERLVGTLNRGVAHGVPGTTFCNIFEKGDYDSVKHTTIKLSTLQEIIRIWIVDYYHQKVHSTLGVPPSHVWRENMNSIDIPLPNDPKKLDSMIGNIERRTLTHKGIEIHGLFYNCRELEKLRNQLGESIKVEVRYDGSDIGYLYVIHPTSNEAIYVDAIYKSYASGLSLWQHRVIQKYKQRFLPERKDLEALAEAKESIRELIMRDFFKKKTKSRVRMHRFLSNADINSGNELTESKKEYFSDAVPSATHEGVYLDNFSSKGHKCRKIETAKEKRNVWNINKGEN